MTVELRAAWRLLRSVLHGLHGLAIVLLRFGGYDLAQRQARIEWWAAKMLRLMGVALAVEGRVQDGAVLLVANHVSWLDINVLHAVVPQARFVSKSAIQHWPLVAQLADAAGTLYLERERKRDALRVVQRVGEALEQGHKVAVFPEGTTSDGRSLLPFHANLLQAAIATATPVQPIALRFSDRHQRISAAVEFVGATTLVASLWRVACGDGLIAHVTLLPARVAVDADRRVLAQLVRDDIEVCVLGR